MNILIIGEGIWDDKNSYGNTLSNFFDGKVWEEDRFFNFYGRSKRPCNKLSVRYFNITDFDIVKSIFRFKVKSREFELSEIDGKTLPNDETSIVNDIHASKSKNIIYFVHELIWNSHLWINKDFKGFIDKVEPDIMFAFLGSTSLLWPAMSYLKSNTKCKLVLFCADENYQNIVLKAPFYRKCYLKKNFISCIKTADCVYTISQEMSDYYKAQFGVKSKLLRKGCCFNFPVSINVGNPIRIVYAGNLLWERDNTLSIIAKTLEKYNINGIKASLEIYSSATITPELEQKLNITGCSKLMGSRPYDEIKQIMHDADIVLHVESFNPEYMETVKYSFSTKIIDCLQSGSQVLGIGPKGLASIEYLRKVDGALVIDEEQSIEREIIKLLDNAESIMDNVRKTRNFAVEHHEIDAVQKKLRYEFEALCTAKSK